MLVRLAHESDAVAIAAAERETAATPGLLVGLPGEVPLHAYSFKINALAHTGRYVVAEQAGSLVGHAFLDPMEMAANSHVFRLTVVVHPGHTGHGVGPSLLRELLNWAQTDSRVGKVELLVRASNARAIRLYRSFGFVEEGRFQIRVRRSDGVYVDDLAMAWFPARDGAP